MSAACVKRRSHPFAESIVDLEWVDFFNVEDDRAQRVAVEQVGRQTFEDRFGEFWTGLGWKRGGKPETLRLRINKELPDEVIVK